MAHVLECIKSIYLDGEKIIQKGNAYHIWVQPLMGGSWSFLVAKEPHYSGAFKIENYSVVENAFGTELIRDRFRLVYKDQERYGKTKDEEDIL